MCICICVYVYPPAPRGHQAAKQFVSSLCTYEVSKSRSLGDLVSCILSPKVSFSLEHCVFPGPRKHPIYHHRTMFPNSLGRSGTCVLRVFSWVSPWDWSCRPRGSSWRPLGLFLDSLGLLLAPLGLPLASSWPPLGPSWPPLGSLWALLRRSGTCVLRVFWWVSPWDLYFRPRGSKPLSLGLSLGYSWLLLGFYWALLRSSLAPFGLVLASSWLLWGSPGTLWDSCFSNVFVGLALGLVLSASGLQDTSSWAPLGLLLAPFGLLLGSSWPPLGPSWLPFGFLWAPLRRSGTRF